LKATANEFAKFDVAVTKIVTVSHDELKRREIEWKKQHQRKQKNVRVKK